jgi:predicted AAA+ superfamily ATPase
MAFVSGPRQVGKTTTCRELADAYLDWDNDDHREIILTGPLAVAQHAGMDRVRERQPVVVLDELHKHSRWKEFLKGLFDTYENRGRFVVTGSSRLDVYKRGGDSLMGRYFPYRMHPFSVAELARVGVPESLLQAPAKIANTDWRALLEHGGYPEPFLKRDRRFTTRWRRIRRDQLLRQDVRDMTRIQDLGQLTTLAQLLADRSGGQLVYASLARTIRVSENTIRNWIEALSSLHYGFVVRPWHKNVSKALRKEPKWFLRDWSAIGDPGKRAETLCAAHLLKAVEGWTDLGLGDFELRYVRDKQKREVDFLVIRDGEPWFLAEVKHSDEELSPALKYFQRQLRCDHAFQIVVETEYVDADCFSYKDPVIAPARTFLSQLL